MTSGLWPCGGHCGKMRLMIGRLRLPHDWTFCFAALGLWIAYGWPVLTQYWVGGTIRNVVVPLLWFVPFAIMGGAVFAGMILRLSERAQWVLLGVQLAAVTAMTLIVPWAGMSSFLVVIAWQVGILTTPGRALGWIAFQNLVIIAALAQALKPDLCWVLTKSGALQMLFVFTAQALRREAATSRALSQTNNELRSAQAIIAGNARNAERLRISRELHDAWGHELTALGLQLEIASHVTDPAKANEHVLEAKGLASALLGKVRDVVSTLREAGPGDLKEGLEALARGIPVPAIHIDITPGVEVSPDRAHALLRCAQEAVTNAVKHADAKNLWLQVRPDRDGVRLIAYNDGRAGSPGSLAGSGLRGMRERLEELGGRLAVQPGASAGFTLDAWLPAATPKPA